MAAVYVDEEEVWKCLKHPSKRRKSGICPVCLRERLVLLCPDCANVRPCTCCAPNATTSSSSSSSSSSRFTAGDGSGIRVSKLLESEPSFRRSRSVAIPFLRSRSRFGGSRHVDFDSGGDRSEPQSGGRTKTPSFWSSVFRSSHRSKRTETNSEYETTEKKVGEIQEEEEDADAVMRRTMMRKSRSVAVPMMSSNPGGGGERPQAKGRGWYFPSPIKAFRNSKISKIVSERSPVYRG